MRTNAEKPITESRNYLQHLVTIKKKELLEFIPGPCQGLVNNLVNVQPKKRADHERLLQGSYFRDPLSQVNDFIQLFFSKTEQQQKEFLCMIGKAVIRTTANKYVPTSVLQCIYNILVT